MRFGLRFCLALVALFAAAAVHAVPVTAQAPAPPLSAEEYARAEQFLAPNIRGLVLNGAVRPNWRAEDRFWYRNAIAEGHEFVVVDAAERTRGRAFDHERLAAALSAAEIGRAHV